MAEKTDHYWMAQAIEQAELGVGLTRPNPPVGAVLVKNGKLIAAGYHRKAGGAHAEKAALKKAGNAARGAEIYVTLEPCSTHGRTPPCTEWLIEYGVKRVVVGSLDPNPAHNGAGIEVLNHAGIQTVVGVESAETDKLVRPFAERMLNSKPYVTLKLATSADGRIADRRGKSQWITGRAARTHVQHLRGQSDGVMVGVNTVMADDPSLLPRPARGRKPYRIVVDSLGRIPLKSKVLNEVSEQTIVVVTDQAPASRLKRIERKGAEVICLPAARAQVNLKRAMRTLSDKGLLHILCEGGGQLAYSLMRDRLVNRLELFVAPCILGGNAMASVGGSGWLMDNNPRFTWDSVRRIGDDVLMSANIT